jgi:GH43 family beta-xylosidase
MHTNTEILEELWHSQMKIQEGKEYIFSAANSTHAHQVSILSHRTGEIQARNRGTALWKGLHSVLQCLNIF